MTDKTLRPALAMDAFDWRALPADELERQFNPRVTVPDFQAYLDRAAEASARARETLPCARDIRYGPRPRQLVDVYPAANPGAPALVYVHGGFWRALSKEASAGIAQSMSDSDITTVVVGYDLCPAVALDDIVLEIDAACRWCAASLPSFGVDPARVHLAGSSAGAHLIATALMRPDAAAWRERFRSVSLVSGLYDVAPVRAISVNADIRLDEAAVARLSPVSSVARVPMPLFVAVGTAESAAWIDQSRRFARACIDAGNAVELLEVPGAHHFSIGAATAGSMMNERIRAYVAMS